MSSLFLFLVIYSPSNNHSPLIVGNILPLSLICNFLSFLVIKYPCLSVSIYNKYLSPSAFSVTK